MLIGLFLILIAGGALLFFSVRRVLMSEFDSGLQARARAMASLVKFEDGRIELEFSDEFMRAFEQKESPDYFQMWIGDGQPFERSRSLEEKNLPMIAGNVGSPKIWDLTLPDGRHGRAAGIRFVVSHEEDEGGDSSTVVSSPRSVTLVAAVGRTELDAELRAVAASLLTVCLFILIGTVVVVNVVIRKGLWPLQAVGQQAAAIEVSSLGSRFPSDDMPSEMRPICERLNELLGRLEESFRRERRFTADVAHELRTPIAELRASSDVALQWPADKEAAERAVQDASAIAVQMEKMVTTLLALARCDAGGQPVLSEPICLSEMVETVWAGLEEQVRTKRLTLVLDIAGDIRLSNDRVMLRSILQNLLSNAVEYSPPSGRVEIRGVTEKSGIVLTVSNPTVGLSPEDVPHLFEPFWRKDAARSDPSHSGLGLALASAFASVMGLALECDLLDDGMICFTLRPGYS